MPVEGQFVDSSPPLSEIEQNSKRFQELAEKVSKELDDIEAWFKKLPSKTDVITTLKDEKLGKFHVLQFRRNNTDWEFALVPADGTSVVTTRTASLTAKCLMVSMIPNLLKSFYQEQRDGVQRLEVAAKILSKLPSLKGGK